MERYNLKNIYPFWGLLLISCIALCVYILLICERKGKNSIIYSLDNSNFIKSISAIGLIFHHYAQVMPTNSASEELLRNVVSAIGYLFSAIFLFSSGYGLAQKKLVSWKNLVIRIIRLYIPYVIASLVSSAFVGFEGGVTTFKQIVTFFVVINGGKFDGKWFIAAIIYFNIIYYLSRFVHNKKTYYLTNLGALVLWIVGCIAINAGQWWYDSSACFLLGIIFADYGDEIKNAFEKSKIKVIVALLSVIIFAASTYFGGIKKQWVGTEVSALIFCMLWNCP